MFVLREITSSPSPFIPLYQSPTFSTTSSSTPYTTPSPYIFLYHYPCPSTTPSTTASTTLSTTPSTTPTPSIHSLYHSLSHSLYHSLSHSQSRSHSPSTDYHSLPLISLSHTVTYTLPFISKPYFSSSISTPQFYVTYYTYISMFTANPIYQSISTYILRCIPILIFLIMAY